MSMLGMPGLCGADVDLLDGGDGKDVLTGGLGRDRIKGGEGADRFVFVDAADATISAKLDVIEDFSHGRDRIDLSALEGELGFIADAAFSGGGAGEVRYSDTTNGRIGQVDVDGDGDADMAIQLTGAGASTLTATDFIL